jgi:hypothetical protein
LTYPSITTPRIHAPRIGAALLPVALLFFAVGIEGGWPKTIYSVIGLLLLMAPYITIAFQLRLSLGGYKPTKHGD